MDVTDTSRSLGLSGRTRWLFAVGWLMTVLVAGLIGGVANAAQTPAADDPNLALAAASVTHDGELDLLHFALEVQGSAGGTVPEAAGALDGAPVLGYVFPTTLAPAEVGFHGAEGVVALAVTAHPDFDDTPLWDENQDGDYANDGAEWHTHWALLGQDDRVPGGLAVVAVTATDPSAALPPTEPGLSIYLDSPGFPVVLRGNRLIALVPVARVYGQTAFNYDAVTATMRVNASNPDLPFLGVYEAHSVLSGDLSLPYQVEQR